MAKIHVLLLDDNTLFRVVLAGFLDQDAAFQVTADCSSMEQGLKALGRKKIDLILLDPDFENGETGLSFVQRARESGYEGRIFLMTSGMTARECLAALADGVCGIFFKHNSPELLIEAIHKVMAGQTWMDQRCIRLLGDAIEEDGREMPRFP